MSVPVEKIAHYQHATAYSWYWKPLKPTGRWKLRLDNDGNIHLLIEHKSFPFNRWIHESGIDFVYPKKEITNKC